MFSYATVANGTGAALATTASAPTPPGAMNMKNADARSSPLTTNVIDNPTAEI
jgi:hypothetical protein